MLGPGRDPCFICELPEVEWVRAARGNFFVHEGGRKACRFPCAGSCEHLDCAEARASTAAEPEAAPPPKPAIDPKKSRRLQALNQTLSNWMFGGILPSRSTTSPKEEDSMSKKKSTTKSASKECSVCEKRKPADKEHFGKNSAEQDKLTRDCRDCRRERDNRNRAAREKAAS